MRIKLSYTVEDDEVLAEAAKILGLASDHMQHCIFLYQDVQRTLMNEPEDPADKKPAGEVDVPQSLEMIEELRQALLALDTRLSEVTDIVTGYEDYKNNPTPEVDNKDKA